MHKYHFIVWVLLAAFLYAAISIVGGTFDVQEKMQMERERDTRSVVNGKELIVGMKYKTNKVLLLMPEHINNLPQQKGEDFSAFDEIMSSLENCTTLVPGEVFRVVAREDHIVQMSQSSRIVTPWYQVEIEGLEWNKGWLNSTLILEKESVQYAE